MTEYTQFLKEPELISGLSTLLKDEDPLVCKRTIRVFANIYRHSLNSLATGELDEPTFSNAWPTVSSVADELIEILENSENEGITVHIVRFLEAAVLAHILADITRYPHVLSKTSPTITKIVSGLLNLLDTDYVGGSAFIVGTRAMITVACYKEDLRKEVVDLIEKKIAKPAATLFDHHIRSLNKMLQRNLFRLLRREQSHKEKERLIEMMVKVGVKRRLLAGWAPPIQSQRKRSAPSQLSTDDIIGRTTPPHKKSRGGDTTPPRSPEYIPSASQSKPEYIPTSSQPRSLQRAPEYIPTKIQKPMILQPNSRPNSPLSYRPNSPRSPPNSPRSPPNSPRSPPNSPRSPPNSPRSPPNSPRSPPNSPRSPPSSQPNSPPSSRPNSPIRSRPNSPIRSRPNSPPSSRPNSPPSSWPNSQSNSLPSSRPNSPPSSVSNSQSNSLPNSRPSSLPNSRPISLPNSRPSSQPNSRPNSPKLPLPSHSGRSTPDRIVNESKTDEVIKAISPPISPPRSPVYLHSGRSTQVRAVNNSMTDDIKVNFDLLQRIIHSGSKKPEDSSIEVIAKALERPQAVEFVLEYMDQLQDIPDEDHLMNQLREVGSDENAKKETLAALLVKILPRNVIEKLKEQNENDEDKTESTSQSVSASTTSQVHTTPVTSGTPLFSSQDVDLRSLLNPKGGDVDMRMFDPRNMQQLNPNDPRMSRSVMNQTSYRDPRSKPSELPPMAVSQNPSRDPRSMTHRDPRRPAESRDPRVAMSRSPNFITERNFQDVDRRSPNFMPDMGRSPNFIQNAHDMDRRSPNFLQNERNYLGVLDPRIRNERVPLVNSTVQNYNHGVPMENFNPNTVPRFNGMNVNNDNMQNNFNYMDRNQGVMKNNNVLNNNQNGWGQSPPQTMLNRAAMRMSAS